MRKFLQNLKSASNVQGTIAIKNSKGECQLHDITRLKNIKANEFCVSCELEMCYICSHKHITNHCDVSWGEDSYKKYNLAPKSQKNKDYNCGHLAKLHLQNLKCPCGKPIEHEMNAGICAACSTATCSKECHDKYAKEVNECTFHHNFTVDMPNQTLRSILFRNAYYLFDNGYGMGTPISKTSKLFTTGYLSDKRDSIYLQRGFRIYGNPAEETLHNLEVFSDDNIDYVTHTDRVCLCSCNVCKPRSIHSVENCSIRCQSKEALIKQEVNMSQGGLFDECHCTCKFCSSGILKLTHNRVQCLFHCQNSSFQISQD
ncbi:hypothetical protein TTHERM_00006140 (macronuclear) [Tetrahymena thermophila SB210]|uniref:Uncharacterized protein n=1 Tax=Tetrahymena thermophila (strain SB210) TaxID=312017 RepID=Q22SC2_TETTS|nr:hypothetical protein TTHERM_00006140 [Tetrahymena thermophila SB210]EAR87850.1 hypothetical protein TTHERM_00006140 [Tetrahymena thermophila SB210]|eukprot:XP_001008095.1 hypothetical protein TTHERM_00006140 [Tetrahymena thermophila SB210]